MKIINIDAKSNLSSITALEIIEKSNPQEFYYSSSNKLWRGGGVYEVLKYLSLELSSEERSILKTNKYKTEEELSNVILSNPELIKELLSLEHFQFFDGRLKQSKLKALFLKEVDNVALLKQRGSEKDLHFYWRNDILELIEKEKKYYRNKTFLDCIELEIKFAQQYLTNYMKMVQKVEQHAYASALFDHTNYHTLHYNRNRPDQYSIINIEKYVTSYSGIDLVKETPAYKNYKDQIILKKENFSGEYINYTIKSTSEAPIIKDLRKKGFTSFYDTFNSQLKENVNSTLNYFKECFNARHIADNLEEDISTFLAHLVSIGEIDFLEYSLTELESSSKEYFLNRKYLQLPSSKEISIIESVFYKIKLNSKLSYDAFSTLVSYNFSLTSSIQESLESFLNINNSFSYENIFPTIFEKFKSEIGNNIFEVLKPKNLKKFNMKYYESNVFDEKQGIFISKDLNEYKLFIEYLRRLIDKQWDKRNILNEDIYSMIMFYKNYEDLNEEYDIILKIFFEKITKDINVLLPFLEKQNYYGRTLLHNIFSYEDDKNIKFLLKKLLEYNKEEKIYLIKSDLHQKRILNVLLLKDYYSKCFWEYSINSINNNDIFLEEVKGKKSNTHIEKIDRSSYQFLFSPSLYSPLLRFLDTKVPQNISGQSYLNTQEIISDLNLYKVFNEYILSLKSRKNKLLKSMNLKVIMKLTDDVDHSKERSLKKHIQNLYTNEAYKIINSLQRLGYSIKKEKSNRDVALAKISLLTNDLDFYYLLEICFQVLFPLLENNVLLDIGEGGDNSKFVINDFKNTKSHRVKIHRENLKTLFYCVTQKNNSNRVTLRLDSSNSYIDITNELKESFFDVLKELTEILYNEDVTLLLREIENCLKD